MVFFIEIFRIFIDFKELKSLKKAIFLTKNDVFYKISIFKKNVKNHRKIFPKSSQNPPKILPKSMKNPKKSIEKAKMA